MSTSEVTTRAAAQARTLSRYRDVVKSPVVSEKSYAGFDEGIYTFVVDSSANKVEIRQAIEALFSVKVENVRTHNRHGKRKRNRKGGGFGTRPDKKIAVVTLKDGDSIEVLGA